MNIILYFIIFISKAIELALGTLRIIVVANGKKVLGAFLQGFIALVWACVTGLVVINITKDPFKIIAFALGSAVGSFIGSFIEEKMALGSNMLMAIIDKNLEESVTKIIREEGYAVTVMNGQGKEKEHSILIIMVERRKRQHIVNLIEKTDCEAMIISESASTVSSDDKKEKKPN